MTFFCPWPLPNKCFSRHIRPILTLVLLAAAASTMNSETLDQARWKMRVLIIYAPLGSEEQLARQEELLRSRDRELEERDVAQIVLRSRSEDAKIAARFELPEANFAVLLIGKDGEEKLRSRDVVSPESLFRLIDSMPMRQEEMRQRERTQSTPER